MKSSPTWPCEIACDRHLSRGVRKLRVNIVAPVQPRAVPLPPYLDAIKISASRIPARPIYHSENTRTANLSSAALSPRSGMPITLVSRYNEISRGFQFHVYLLLDSEVPFHLCLPYNLCLKIYVRILTPNKHEK